MTLSNNLWSWKQPTIPSQPSSVNNQKIQQEKLKAQKNLEWEQYKEKMGFAAGFFASLGGCFLALRHYETKFLPPINVPLAPDENIAIKALSILGICIGIPSLIYLLTPNKPESVINKRSRNAVLIETNEVNGQKKEKINPSNSNDKLSDTHFLQEEIIAIFEEQEANKKKKQKPPILIPNELHVVNPDSLKETYDIFIQFIRDKPFRKTNSSIITYLETIRGVHSFNENQERVLDAIMTSIKEQLDNGNISVNNESYKIITEIFKDLSEKSLSVSLITVDLPPKTENSSPAHEIINNEEFVVVDQRDILDSFILIENNQR